MVHYLTTYVEALIVRGVLESMKEQHGLVLHVVIHDALFVYRGIAPEQVLSWFGQAAAEHGHWIFGVAAKDHSEAQNK
eukprot:11327094-Karenia_brevis.AAC.1